jgi:hypothetical protein
MNTPSTRLIPVPDWNKYHAWPPLGGLRWMIFNAKDNGFDAVVRRCRRRVLIDEAAFFRWVESQNSSGASADAPSAQQDKRVSTGVLRVARRRRKA